MRFQIICRAAGAGGTMAHVDYTLNYGPKRLKDLLPGKAETLQKAPAAPGDFMLTSRLATLHCFVIHAN